MTPRGRGLTPEARAQLTQIRSAARRGLGASEIAAQCQSTLAVVNRAIASANHARISDPVAILATSGTPIGHAPEVAQLYWIGFLTAAGRVFGLGPSMSIVITLGDRAERQMTRFAEDITGGQVRQEYCQSSLLGWQVYVRDPSLCRALIPWGVLSDSEGEDPTILEDLPTELVPPFVAGYLDGNWPASSFPTRGRLVLHGTPDMMSAMNRMLRRCWAIPDGKVTLQPPRAILRYAAHRTDQQIADHARPHMVRRVSA